MRDFDEKLRHRLTNKAVHYLGRYASTTSRLKDVLARFAERKLTGFEPDQLNKAIDDVIRDCVQKGYVNDQLYAEQKASSLRRQGRSRRMIEKTLAARGLDQTVITAAFSDDEIWQDETGDWRAALIYARRRRLGPYTTEGDRQGDPEKMRQRHLASFARAGFSLSLAREILALDTPGEADDMLEQKRLP